MNGKITEIAERIRTLREILEITQEEMAAVTECTVEEYRAAENGENDFSFTFLYKCAEHFGVDIVELLTGEPPKLSFYTITRKGQGIPIKRRAGFEYLHIAHLFKEKTAEPFIVTAPYHEEEQDQPIHLSHHEGQEFDYILEGQLKVVMEDHIEILNEGDCIYYDSGHGHGMIATGGKPCTFMAVVLKPQDKREDQGNE